MNVILAMGFSLAQVCLLQLKSTLYDSSAFSVLLSAILSTGETEIERETDTKLKFCPGVVVFV